MRKSKRRIAEEAAYVALRAKLEIYRQQVCHFLAIPRPDRRRVSILYGGSKGYYLTLPVEVKVPVTWVRVGENARRSVYHYNTPELVGIVGYNYLADVSAWATEVA